MTKQADQASQRPEGYCLVHSVGLPHNQLLLAQHVISLPRYLRHLLIFIDSQIASYTAFYEHVGCLLTCTCCLTI